MGTKPAPLPENLGLIWEVNLVVRSKVKRFGAVALPVVSFSFFIQSSALQIIPSGPIADKAETLDYPAIPFAYALPLNSNVADSKTQKLRNPGYKGAVLGKV